MGVSASYAHAVIEHELVRDRVEPDTGDVYGALRSGNVSLWVHQRQLGCVFGPYRCLGAPAHTSTSVSRSAVDWFPLDQATIGSFFVGSHPAMMPVL